MRYKSNCEVTSALTMRTNTDDEQELLDEFFRENPNKRVSRIFYEPGAAHRLEWIASLEGKRMLTTSSAAQMRQDTATACLVAYLSAPELIGRHLPHPIFVGDQAFEEMNREEFGRLVKGCIYPLMDDIYNGPRFPHGTHLTYRNAGQFQPCVINGLLLVRARLRQIDSSRLSEIDDLTATAMEHLHLLTVGLRRIRPATRLERDVIESQLQMYVDPYSKN